MSSMKAAKRSAKSQAAPRHAIAKPPCATVAPWNSKTWSVASSAARRRSRARRFDSKRRSRVAESMLWLTRGYEMKVADIVGDAAVRGSAPVDGDGARHRAVFAVRASHAAVLRQGAHRLHSRRQYRGPLETAAHRRNVRAAAAGAGAAHRADRRSRFRMCSSRSASVS